MKKNSYADACDTEKTICNHKYHIICIDEWKKKYNTCPLCREIIINKEPYNYNIRSKNIVTIYNDLNNDDIKLEQKVAISRLPTAKISVYAYTMNFLIVSEPTFKYY